MSDARSPKNRAENLNTTSPVGAAQNASTGWAATEDYMLEHDVGMVKDYSDDVDTLLVFAGLFSAVLTAFVIESYHLLQVDNAENTVKLLARMSAQLESFTMNQGFINSTRSALSIPDFTPDKASLWINVMWFLSLLFSLAAALFGILVKQWLREYMQWSSALATSRENVLVRQIRFEAWNEWNVAASISSIPALLEVALILFVCGLVVLLWTLDPVVALVITIATVVFLMIVSSVTLLPAFFKRCPYKSPTAWACILVWELIRDMALFVVNFVKFALTSDNISSNRLLWQLEHWHTPAAHWRERDIAGACPSHFADEHGKNRGALSVIHEELAGEWVALDETEEREYQKEPNLDAITLDAVHDAFNPIGEVPVLFRALSWVSTASQEIYIQDQVLRCTESLHSAAEFSQGPRTNLVEVLGVDGVRNISIWYLLSRGWQEEASLTFPPDTSNSRVAITSLRKLLRMGYVAAPFSIDGQERHPVVRYEINWPLLEAKSRGGFWRYSIPETQIISHLIASDVKTTVLEMLSDWSWYTEHLVHGRRAIELLCALRFILRANAPAPDFRPTCVSILVVTYNIVRQSPRIIEFDTNFPGVRCAIIELAWRFAVIDMDSHGRFEVLSIERQPIATPMSAMANANLVLKFPLTDNREDRHIFVQLVDRCLGALVYEHIPTETSVLLLEKIGSVAQESLEKGWWNCGYYTDLPWLETLRKGPMITFQKAHATLLSRLLDCLGRSIDAGLLAGSAAEELGAIRAGRLSRRPTGGIEEESAKEPVRGSGRGPEKESVKELSTEVFVDDSKPQDVP